MPIESVHCTPFNKWCLHMTLLMWSYELSWKSFQICSSLLETSTINLRFGRKTFGKTNVQFTCQHLFRKSHLSILMKSLTNFMPLVSFDTPSTYQETFGFLMFSRGTERDQWHEMG